MIKSNYAKSCAGQMSQVSKHMNGLQKTQNTTDLLLKIELNSNLLIQESIRWLVLGCCHSIHPISIEH